MSATRTVKLEGTKGKPEVFDSLTGKCKEAFEKWYSIGLRSMNYTAFEIQPFSMQWGVYLEFFDSVGIQIDIDIYLESFKCFLHTKEKTDANGYRHFDTRQQAQTEAITKANELFNA